ncbi:hypothetical protein H261_18365 [Paramagnetospirillum caucaseum]|uniref:OmpA-like domain-containing protein n=1 Tax=Paramagnetospirillum caucaseum TaxID=1244869 RepID=M2Y5V3_9PROT|nr:hypothetical protein [Paramagnetospirillum caucaseum]EME68451.1 hypothetical protein H261_18365 [Paramagnetospirillum caucaseum]
MFDCIEAWRRRHERRTLAVGRSVAIVALIAGCSYVPDALNPVEWYKGVAGVFEGDDAPVVAAPRRPDGSFPNVNEAGAKSSGKGLAADKGNAKYAESVRREPTPTKQLAKRTPPAQTQVAEAPAAAAQDASGKGSYQPSLDRRMQAARDEGPNAPPAAAPGGPPARAEIPDAVPTRRGLLAEHFQKRLAESAVATNKGDPFTGVPAARTQASYSQPAHTYAVPAPPPMGMARSPSFAADTGERAPQLTPPKGLRGAKGMVAAPKAPAASFEVASVQFGPNGGLTAADGAQLREVAALQRQTGGVVRVVGYPSPGAVSFAGQDDASVALGRAKAVAKSLTGLGVPARKIMVAADPAASSAFDDSGARVSIEY